MLASGLTNPRCTVDCLQLHQAWQQPLSHAALLRHRGVTHRPFVRHRQTECRSVPKEDDGWKQISEVSSTVPMQRSLTDSWLVKGAAAAFLLAVALSMLRRLGRRSSVSDLEDRGYLDESRDNADPYLEDIMKNVNKVQYEELTDEQIAAARKRRARGIADYRKADVDVPANHPFATKKELTPEEEELLKKRLDVKRGAPVQDLSGRRGYPGQPGFEPQ